MTELNEKTIEAMKKISDVIKETDFYLNRFTVGESGLGLNTIDFEIRAKGEKSE